MRNGRSKPLEEPPSELRGLLKKSKKKEYALDLRSAVPADRTATNPARWTGPRLLPTLSNLYLQFSDAQQNFPKKLIGGRKLGLDPRRIEVCLSRVHESHDDPLAVKDAGA